MGKQLERPRALTPEVQAKIIQYMAEGNYFAPSCIAAGTTVETVEYWRKLYEAGAEHAQTFADFFSALARARAVAEVNALSDLNTGRPGWQARAWFLERRYRNRWGNKQKVEASLNVNPEAIFESVSNPRDQEVPPPTEAT